MIRLDLARPAQADRMHVSFTSGAFGRITSMAGTPRIMRFGIKYGF